MKAIGYIRVSDTSQIEGYSLDAQERLIREHCAQRDWTLGAIYREEGRSAKYEAIGKRPVFQQLLQDAEKGTFDAVVVHTLDRWSRNLKVTLESVSNLARHNVGLVSLSENLDWSTPQGRLVGQMLGGFAEYFSGALSNHVKKGVRERARQGKHLGGIPFGYQTCKTSPEEIGLPCEPEHPGGVHLVPEEAKAINELFNRYAPGTITLARLASWLNEQGFRTRNMQSSHGTAAEPRLFTSASVRGILHNAFYTGRVRHHDQLLPGIHEAVVSEALFQTVQDALRRNSGRSETLHSHPVREYLLKGLVRCAYCRMPMWAQTYNSGSRLYREHHGSRGLGPCVTGGSSIPCDVADEQVGRIIQAIVLPDAWMNRVLAKLQLQEEAARIQKEHQATVDRLRRLGRAFVDGLYSQEDYQREKRALEDRIASLVSPDQESAIQAGKLLENLPELWRKATMGERRSLLLTMLDAVYVDAREEKRVVAIKPKAAFRSLFEIATMEEGSGIVLVSECQADHDEGCCPTEITRPPDDLSEGLGAPCLWWRRGRVELPVQRALKGIYSRRSHCFGSYRTIPQ